MRTTVTLLVDSSATQVEERQEAFPTLSQRGGSPPGSGAREPKGNCRSCASWRTKHEAFDFLPKFSKWHGVQSPIRPRDSGIGDPQHRHRGELLEYATKQLRLVPRGDVPESNKADVGRDTTWVLWNVRAPSIQLAFKPEQDPGEKTFLAPSWPTSRKGRTRA